MLVVFNTVKLAVSFKSKEIEVMRLVGASESFVRVPFLIEGFLHGLFATIVSIALIFAAITLAGYFSQTTIFARFIDRLTPVYFEEFWFITGLQFLVGAVIGVGASWLSIRKNVKI
jgi:cell division transport system permease protein